jgi:hypothetical protein
MDCEVRQILRNDHATHRDDPRLSSVVRRSRDEASAPVLSKSTKFCGAAALQKGKPQ